MKTTKRWVQIERSGSGQPTYWQTPIQPPSISLASLAAEGEIVDRPDLSRDVQGVTRCRVIQVRSGGVYAGTAGRFFARV